MVEERSISDLTVSLKAKYREHTTIERLFYPDHPLPIEQCYLDLALIEDKIFQDQKDNQGNMRVESRDYFLHDYERIQHIERKLTPEQLLTECHSISKRIYIEGAAGAGKTTLSQFITYQWGTDHPAWKDYDFLFRIRLRDLTSANYPELEIDFIKFLEKECFRFGFSDSLMENEKNRLLQYLKSKTKKVLFILDGYDELTLENHAIKMLWKNLINSTYDFIITSRPGMQKSDLKVNLNVAVLGFSNEQVGRYISYFFDPAHTPGVKVEDAEFFLQTLIKNPNLWSLAHTPIQLELLCSMQESKIIQTPDITLTQIYTLMLEQLLKRYEHKRLRLAGKNDISLRDINIEPLLESTVYFEFLENLAFLGMEKNEVIISYQIIEDAYNTLKAKPKNKPAFFDILKTLGFITRDSDGRQMEYIHLTFQEYFAARYIVRYFSLQQSPKLYSTLNEFIAKQKNNPHYEIVWWFVTGLLKDDAELLKSYFHLFQSEPHDLAEIYQFNLQLRCLAECELKVTQDTKDKILNRLKALIEQLRDYNPIFNRLNIPDIIIKEEKIVEALLNKLKNNAFENIVYGGMPNNLPTTILEKLIKLLLEEKDDSNVAFDAAHVLSNQIQIPHNILGQLTELLKDSSKCSLAAVALSGQRQLPIYTYQVLSEIFKNHKNHIRRYFFMEFLQKANLPESILQQLVELLSDPLTQEDVAKVLFKQTKLPDSIQHMLCVQLSSNSAQKYAAKALSNQRQLPEYIIEDLHKLLGNPVAQRYAAEALSGQKKLPVSIVQILCEQLSNSTTQKYAAKTLSNQQQLPEYIIEVLYILLGDPVTLIYAAEALSGQTKLPEHCLQALCKLLDSNLTQEYGIKALSSQAQLPISVLLMLGEQLKHSATQRYAAEILFNQIEIPEVILLQMLKLLSDKNAHRYTAIALSGQRQLPKFVLDALEKLLMVENTKFSAAIVLSSQKKLTPSILQILSKLLTNKEIEIVRDIHVPYLSKVIWHNVPNWEFTNRILNFESIRHIFFESYSKTILIQYDPQVNFNYIYLSCQQGNDIAIKFLDIAFEICFRENLSFYFYENILYIGDKAQGEFSSSCQNYIKEIFKQITQKDLGFHMELNESISYDNKTILIENLGYHDQPIFIDTCGDNYAENLNLPASNTNPSQESRYNFNTNINNYITLALYGGTFIFIVFIVIKLYKEFYPRRNSVTQNTHLNIIDSMPVCKVTAPNLTISKERTMQEKMQKYDVFISEMKGTQEAIDVLISHTSLKARVIQELHTISNELEKAKSHAEHSNKRIRSAAQTTYEGCINKLGYLKNILAHENIYPVDELNRVCAYVEDIISKVSPKIELYPYSITQMQEVQSQGLFFTQRFLHNALNELSPLGQSFKELLETIKTTMGSNRYSCFISYAKPINENGPDHFLQPFLDTLRDHLLLAGFNPLLDFKCIEAGDNIEIYMKQTLISNYWLLIGTPSLPQRLNQPANVTFETRIEKLREVNKLSDIYPMIPLLVVGNAAQSFPWHKQRDSYIDLTQSCYLASLKKLLQTLSRIPEFQYNDLWKTFETSYPEHMQALSSSLIKQILQNEKQKERQKNTHLEKKQAEIYQPYTENIFSEETIKNSNNLFIQLVNKIVEKTKGDNIPIDRGLLNTINDSRSLDDLEEALSKYLLNFRGESNSRHVGNICFGLKLIKYNRIRNSEHVERFIENKYKRNKTSNSVWSPTVLAEILKPQFCDEATNLLDAVIKDKEEIVKDQLEALQKEGQLDKINSRRFNFNSTKNIKYIFNTPLMIAARRRNTDIVKLLIEYGADKKLKDGKGRTAYQIVSKKAIKSKEEKEMLSYKEVANIISIHERRLF